MFELLLLMTVLLLLKGFFSGSEIAFVNVDQLRLRHRAAKGEGGAKLALRLLEDAPKLLTTTLLGTNIVSILLTTVGTLLMVTLVGASRAEIVALIVYTPLFLIFGEIVPKSVYQQKADVIVPWVAYPLAWLQVVFAPLVWLFSRVARLAAMVMGGGTSQADALREQFATTVHMAEQSGASAAFSKGQVRRVLRFAQTTAAEVMWPLTNAKHVKRSASMAKLVQVRRETGQRLVPLYEDEGRNVCAIARIESWDLLDPDLETRAVDEFLTDIVFVPHLQRVSEIFEQVREDPALTVVVVDELGNSLGLITLSLLVRRTLGAETSPLTGKAVKSRELPRATRHEDGSVSFDARMPVVEVNDALDIALPTLQASTLGGIALAHIGHMPKVGDAFSEHGWRFEVTEVSDRAVQKLTARRSLG